MLAVIVALSMPATAVAQGQPGPGQPVLDDHALLRKYVWST